jgi:hypothetical protein
VVYSEKQTHMRKTILISALMLCTSVAGWAQNAAKYCELIVYRPNFKNYVAEMHSDGGTTRQQSLLRDAKGNVMKFTDEAEALNYIARQGWDLVSSYYNNHRDETHFIVKK